MKIAAQDLQTLGLRDIHEPVAVTWWPPAPGWWLLAAALLAAAFLLLRGWYLRRRLPRAARRALEAAIGQWRQDGDDHALLAALSGWLRRVAIAADGRRAMASLVGARWRDRLNRDLEDAPFARAPGSLLLDAAYRPVPPALDEASVAKLRRLCLDWLGVTMATRRTAP